MRASGGSYLTWQPHVFAAFVFGFPLLMGFAALALGIWAVFRRPGSIRAAFFTAAAVVVALQFVLTSGVAGTYGAQPTAPALVSFGDAVFFAGAFLTMVAAFLGWRRSATA